MNGGGWERISSRSRLHRDETLTGRETTRTVRLGRVQPQAPGHRTIFCNDRDSNLPVRFKVIGKALVLDEIINYIQSLQRQVEFLSMKLEAVNTRMNPEIEVFPSKDFGHQSFDPASMAFVSQAAREFSREPSPEWLHMQVGGGFERTS